MFSRHRVFILIGCSLVAAMLLTLAGLAGENVAYAAERGAPKGSLPSATSPSGETGFASGDTLQIRFFDVLDRLSRASNRPTLSDLVERSELTGRYVIQLDGTVYVPLIGTVEAAGLSPEGLQNRLELKFQKAFKRPIKAMVRLLKREPIYVTGSVPEPGVFDYTPGMTVLHAMILAGMRTEGPQNPDHIAIMQETEHLRKSNATLVNLIARRDVLVALRDGKDAAPSPELIKLVGPEAAHSRIAAASRLVTLETEKEKSERDALSARLQAIEKERKILTKAISDAKVALEHATSWFGFVSKNKNRGLLTQSSILQAEDSVDLARGQFNGVRASLADLEARAIELRGKKAATIVDAKIARQREIDNLQSSIVEAMITQNTLAPVLRFGPVVFGHADKSPKVRLLRRSSSGLVTLDATELSLLRPGDIVEVISPLHTVFGSEGGPDAVGDSN